MIAASRTRMRVAVAALVAAMLLATPGVARAEEQSEAAPPNGLCVVAWVEVLGIGPHGVTSWFCLFQNCSSLTGASNVLPTAPPTLDGQVGFGVPNFFACS